MQNFVCKQRWGDVIGKRPEDLLVDEHNLALWLENNRRAFSGKTVRGEIELIIDDETGYYDTVVSPIYDGDKVRGILGINIDITERKKAEEALRKAHDDLERRVEERTAKLRKSNTLLKQEIIERERTEEASQERERDLEIKSINLEEANAALRVLLKKRDENRAELEDKVLCNVKNLVFPYLEKLKQSGLDDRQMEFARILESNVNDIISPFSRTLSSRYLNLTPAELEVANLVKQGKTSKDIAGLLNVSNRTVETHRDHIRRKLGLSNKKANLRIHLMSVQ